MHFGVGQTLTRRITIYERPSRFRDSMVRGAFSPLAHDHHFAEEGRETVMRDVFEFGAPWGESDSWREFILAV